MYFDFEDARPETPTIERAISLREGVMFSVIAHVLVFAAVLFVPELPFVKAIQQRAAAAAAAEAERLRALELERARENARRFVMVRPLLDIEAPTPPPRAELSDKDRRAQAPERARNPTNPLPYSRGNSIEREIAPPTPRPDRTRPEPVQEMPQRADATQQPAGPPGPEANPSPATRQSNGGPALEAPEGGPLARNRGEAGAPGQNPGSGLLGQALRNLQQYMRADGFENPSGGGGQFGPSIQFDTKGVEFGPWIRRFIAQIKRNWFIPMAAMSFKGHVVITFNVHKDGSITDLTVVKPSSIDSFNHAAYNALAASNPTQPLPEEYPSPRAFFTVTFYYNETPPSP